MFYLCRTDRYKYDSHFLKKFVYLKSIGLGGKEMEQIYRCDQSKIEMYIKHKMK